MNIKDFTGVISKTAPILGSLLGSPLTGAVISLIAGHFDAPTNDLSQLATLISQDPNKLKELEMKHQEALLSIGLTWLSDTQAKSPPWINALIILVILGSGIGVLAWMLYG